MLIDGNFVGGPCDQATPKSIIRSPYDGSVVGSYAEGGWNEANAALEASKEAFEVWKQLPFVDRARVLLRAAEAIRSRRQELAEIMVLEIAKPITLALAEIDRTAMTFDLAANCEVMLEPVELSVDFDPRGADYSVSYQRVPVGPVLCIVPYNWPFNLAAHKIAPALAAGNTVIVKPSPLAALSTLSLIRIVHEAGAPPGVIQAICCEPVVAERMGIDDRTKMVSFTGSPKVGWHLKSLLPEKRVLLELGGNAFAIVLEDADLEWAAKRLAFAAFAFAGQICISLQHVLVQETVYEKFVELLVAESEAIAFGDPSLSETVCGPLISSDAAYRIVLLIEDSESRGSKVLVGGSRIGNIVEPTILESPYDGASFPTEIELYREEAFGPIVTVSRVKSLGDACKIVNASKYGIHASVFSENPEAAIALLDVGGVVLNDFPLLRFDNMPYGGVRLSGFGREGVEFAIEELTDKKTVIERKMQ